MNFLFRSRHLILLPPLHASSLVHAAEDAPRATQNFNLGWKFQLGDSADASKLGFDDSDWDSVDLPRSFSTPYFMSPDFYTGYGWYRKSFEVPAALQGKRNSLEFEAARQDPEFFVNGEKTGSYGHS